MSQPVRSYLLFGAKADVWPVAAMLAAQLPASIAITVVEEADRSGELVALPVEDPYFHALELKASDLTHAGASFALGYALDGFLGSETRILAAPSGDLPAIGGLALHHVLRRVAGEAGALDRLAELYEGFRFCARAAAEGRMGLPGDAPDSPLAMLGPLAIIDSSALAPLLVQRLAKDRVRSVAGEIARLDRDDNGRVLAAWTEDGAEVTADLFIDLRSPGETVDGGETMALPVLDTAFAGGVVVRAHLNAEPLPRYIAQAKSSPSTARPFALQAPWVANLIRLGPASARLGSLFSADGRLLLTQAVHLAQCLPASADMSVEARRFNQLHSRSVSRFDELVAAPLFLNRRTERHWRNLRKAAPPEGLALRIDQFRSRGRLPELDGEVVDRQFWIDLLMAFGVIPERHDRRAEAFDPRQLDRALGTIRAQLDQTLAAMPPHADFGRRFGAA